MIQSIDAFCKYFAGIRARTLNYLRVIPPDQLDWAPAAGQFTCGEIVRHLITTEQMFTGVVVTGRWRYGGHTGQPGDTLDGLLAELAAGHAAAEAALRALPDSVLLEPRPTLDGPPVKAWRILMILVEHEVHHRSQLACYLATMGVPPPQIYGLGVEDVIARATG